LAGSYQELTERDSEQDSDTRRDKQKACYLRQKKLDKLSNYS